MRFVAAEQKKTLLPLMANQPIQRKKDRRGRESAEGYLVQIFPQHLELDLFTKSALQPEGYRSVISERNLHICPKNTLFDPGVLLSGLCI
jgi:hypothetical protein